MSSRINPTLIGAFVLGSLILGLGAIFLLSNGSLSHQSVLFILYFEGDVKGLQVGSPVNFRGVKVGQVESMTIAYSKASGVFRIPVIIGVENDRVKMDGVVTSEAGFLNLQDLIQQGLRARLNLQSLVTGKLQVELDFLPDTPIRLVSTDDRYPEIPTVQSGMEKLAHAIEQFPLERITQRLSKILDNVDQFVEKGELNRLITSLVLITERLEKVSKLLDQQTPVILENSNHVLKQADHTLEEIAHTANNAQAFITKAEKELAQAMASWDKTMSSGDEAIVKVGDLAESAKYIIHQDSEIMKQLNQTLLELGAAARSIRIMSEYLERHPEALIQGKQ
jgi:paraquat-inducible protein B